MGRMTVQGDGAALDVDLGAKLHFHAPHEVDLEAIELKPKEVVGKKAPQKLFSLRAYPEDRMGRPGYVPEKRDETAGAP